MHVRDVMTTDVVTARPDTTLPQLVELMVTADVTGLPVIDDDRRVVGVVSEADLLAGQAATDERPRRLLTIVAKLLGGATDRWAQKAAGVTTAEIMTAPAQTVAAWMSLRYAATAMLTHGVKRLPVVDYDGRLVGIVSRRDLLRLFHRSDEEIAADVQALLSDPLQCPEQHAVRLESVDSGVARLYGWTSSSNDARLINLAVRAVPGVIGVRSGITTRRHAGAA